MSAIVAFNNLNLEVIEYQDTWALSDRQVAQGFGVTQNAIQQQRTKGATEYIEGVHYYYKDMYNDGKGGLTDTPVGSTRVYQKPQKMVFWTKKGVITLGFKLTETPQTILFRDWASDYILNRENNPTSIQDVLADPRAVAKILLDYADTQDKNKYLEAKIKADEPYVDYGRTVEATDGCILIGTYAKTLCNQHQGINTGRTRIFQIMRELKILQSNNEPYQEYLDKDYLRYIPCVYKKPNGEKVQGFTPMITPKGQVRLTEKIIGAIKAKNMPREVKI